MVVRPKGQFNAIIFGALGRTVYLRLYTLRLYCNPQVLCGRCMGCFDVRSFVRFLDKEVPRWAIQMGTLIEAR